MPIPPTARMISLLHIKKKKKHEQKKKFIIKGGGGGSVAGLEERVR